MFLLQCDHDIVTGTLQTHAVPDGGEQGLPEGRRFVEVPEGHPHHCDPMYWHGKKILGEKVE